MLLKFLFFILCAFQRHNFGDFVSFSFLIFFGKRHYVDFSRTCDTWLHNIYRLNIGSYASGSRFRADHVGKFWQTLGYVVFTKFSPFLSRYCVDITDLRSKIGFSDLLHLILIKFCPDQSVNVLQQTFLYVRLQLSMIHIMYVIVIWNLIEFK